MKTITEMFWSYLVIVGGFYWFWRKDLFTAGHLKSLYRIAAVIVACSNLYIFNSKANHLKDFTILPITSVLLITLCYLAFAYLINKICHWQKTSQWELMLIFPALLLPTLALVVTVLALTLMENKSIEESGQEQLALINDIQRLSHFLRITEQVNSQLLANFTCSEKNSWVFNCSKTKNAEYRALAQTLKTIITPILEHPDIPPESIDQKPVPSQRLLIDMELLTAMTPPKKQEIFIRLNQLAKHLKVIPAHPTDIQTISDPEVGAELYDPLGVDVNLTIAAKESSKIKTFKASIRELKSNLLVKLLAPSQAGIYLGELLLVILILLDGYLSRHKPDSGSPPINTTDDDDMNIPHW